jgi:hypothetical protein
MSTLGIYYEESFKRSMRQYRLDLSKETLMRIDEEGLPCPETLGEYLDVCVAISGAYTEAVEYLESEIKKAPWGREQKVKASDFQMKAILYPLMFRKSTRPVNYNVNGILLN